MATRCFWPPLIVSGILVGLGLHLDQLEHAVDLVVDFLPGALFDPQAEGDVVADRQMREQRVALEDGVDLAAGWAASCVISWPLKKTRPVSGRSKPARMRSSGGLAAAAGAEQGKELTHANRQGDLVNSPDAAEMPGYIFKFKKIGSVHCGRITPRVEGYMVEPVPSCTKFPIIEPSSHPVKNAGSRRKDGVNLMIRGSSCFICAHRH